MQFHEYKTLWTIHRHRASASGCSEVGEFYARIMKRVVAEQSSKFLSDIAECMSELAWIDGRRPYYKCYPRVVFDLMASRLSVSGELFRVPHKAFAIRLPIASPWDCGNGMFLRSILVYLDTNSSGDNVLFVNGRTNEFDMPKESIVIPVPISHASDIESWIDSLPFDDQARPVAMAAARLSISISLLAVSEHRVIECDVLKELRERYLSETDEVKRDAMVEKSKRRGVYGWTVGRDLKLETVHKDRIAGLSGKQLKYQHERGGHWHTVCFGDGRANRKAVWYQNIIVRPDLPVREVG